MIHLGRKALTDLGVEIRSIDRGGRSQQRHIDITFGILIKYGLIERSFDPYPLNEHRDTLKSEVDLINTQQIKPQFDDSSPSGTRSTLSTLYTDSIDVIKIHSVVQMFCRDELKGKNDESYNWFHAAAIKVFCQSYRDAADKTKTTKSPGLVKDYREYETHARRLASHFLKPSRVANTLRQELDRVMEKIKQEIENHSPTSSQESFRNQKSVFDRTSSTSSVPDSRTTSSSRSAWDDVMGHGDLIESPGDINLSSYGPWPSHNTCC